MIRLRTRTKMLAFVALAAILVFLPIHWGPKREVYHPTMLDFAKIESFMTESQVEAILGPPHKVLTGKSSKNEFYRPNGPNQKVLIYYGRKNAQRQFTVFNVKINTANAEGQVVGYGTGTDFEQSALERVMEWFKNLFAYVVLFSETGCGRTGHGWAGTSRLEVGDPLEGRGLAF